MFSHFGDTQAFYLDSLLNSKINSKDNKEEKSIYLIQADEKEIENFKQALPGDVVISKQGDLIKLEIDNTSLAKFITGIFRGIISKAQQQSSGPDIRKLEYDCIDRQEGLFLSFKSHSGMNKSLSELCQQYGIEQNRPKHFARGCTNTLLNISDGKKFLTALSLKTEKLKMESDSKESDSDREVSQPSRRNQRRFFHANADSKPSVVTTESTEKNEDSEDEKVGKQYKKRGKRT